MSSATHVCHWTPSERYARDGAIRQDFVCLECHRARVEVPNVKATQPRLPMPGERKGK